MVFSYGGSIKSVSNNIISKSLSISGKKKGAGEVGGRRGKNKQLKIAVGFQK